MSDFKKRILALLADEETTKKQIASTCAPRADNSSTCATSKLHAPVFLKHTTKAPEFETKIEEDDLPIYEATPEEISSWFVFSFNSARQRLLAKYSLDVCANFSAHCFFKIGYDCSRHVMTLAIDETHYHVIHFAADNETPKSTIEADRVLKKISRIRKAKSRFIEFYGEPCEVFD